MTQFAETVVEEAALEWLRDIGYSVIAGQDIVPGESGSLRATYGDVVLAEVLRGALRRLNPDLPSEAIEDAFRKLTRPEGPTSETRNRRFHRRLIDGVDVEYRRPDGSIAGDKVWLVQTFPSTPTATTGWSSISSPSSRTIAIAAPTWSSSSTACPWPSSS